MSIVGYLVPSDEASLDHFSGEVKTMQIQLAFELRTNERRHSDKSPSHVAVVRTSGRVEVQIGSAWLREAKTGAHRGRQFLSINIDDPSMDRPLNLTAYPPEESGDWEIVWKRQRAQTTDQTEAA